MESGSVVVGLVCRCDCLKCEDDVAERSSYRYSEIRLLEGFPLSKLDSGDMTSKRIIPIPCKQARVCFVNHLVLKRHIQGPNPQAIGGGNMRH